MAAFTRPQNLPFFDAAGVARNVQFFTNALNLEVTGVDVVATTHFDWGRFRRAHGRELRLQPQRGGRRQPVPGERHPAGERRGRGGHREELSRGPFQHHRQHAGDPAPRPHGARQLLRRALRRAGPDQGRGRQRADQAARLDRVRGPGAAVRPERLHAHRLRRHERVRRIHRRDRRAIREPASTSGYRTPVEPRPTSKAGSWYLRASHRW